MRNGGIHVPNKKRKEKIFKISKKLTSLFCAVDQLSFHQSSMGSSNTYTRGSITTKKHLSSTRTHKKIKCNVKNEKKNERKSKE